MSEQRRRNRRTREGCSRRAVLTATGVAGAAALGGCTGIGTGSRGDTGAGDALTMFHAGSLAPPMAAAAARFEDRTDSSVNREAKGSVASVQKITAQGRTADVLGVSDYRLLPSMVLPQFGDWYAAFATNALTIAYTDDSTGADEIGTDNWWEVLAREDVRFGHSDPAADPNGYRAVMAMQLGAMPFRGDSLYGRKTYRALREKELVPADTETALIGQLHAGALDYAWQYQSVQATEDVNTVALQSRVALSRTTPEFERFYANAEVKAGGETYTGAPIAYGITVPDVAESPAAAAQFVDFVTSNTGDAIMRDAGFTPIEPAVVPRRTREAVPEEVLRNATAKPLDPRGSDHRPATETAGSSRHSRPNRRRRPPQRGRTRRPGQ